MILVVLALIWVLALTPTLLRKLSERESTYSVAKFHRSLRVMRRAYPGMAAAAQQGGVVTPARPQPHMARPAGPSARRRRQVLTILGGTLVGTLLLGLIPGLGILWDVSLLTLALTAGYVALLIHFRRVAVERSRKVVVLREQPLAGGAHHGLDRREARATPAVIGG